MSVTLFVYMPRKGKDKARPLEVCVDPTTGEPLSHASANRLAHGLYAGIKTRVKDTRQKVYPKGTTSYADMMAGRVA